MDAELSATALAGPRAGLRHLFLAVALALAGGAFGIVGAFVEELRSGGGLLVVIAGAPIIEEVLKPSGLYVLLARWPYAVRSQLAIASLAALAGLTFGLLESTVYVTLYVPDHSGAFFVYRFTVTVLLHAGTSCIAGLGVSRALVRWASAGGRFPRASRNAFVAAITLHALYNVTAVALGLAGVLDFD